jgi:hypothetical protein
VLQADSVEHIVKRLRSEVQSKIDSGCGNGADLRARRLRLESEIERLTNAIAAGEPSQSIWFAIRERERELRATDEKLSAPTCKSTDTGIEGIRRFALSRLMDLRALLSKPENITRVRAMLAEHVGKIKLSPALTGGYAALGTFDVIGGSGLRVSGAEGQS